jgi:putative flippase GtrA
MNRQLIKQIFQYGLVGVTALGVDVGVFTLCRMWGADLLVANTAARFAGAVTAYTGNYLWTFSQKAHAKDWVKTSWRYVVIWVGATTLSTVLINTLINVGLTETYAKLAVEMALPILNFLLSRYWVFKTRDES